MCASRIKLDLSPEILVEVLAQGKQILLISIVSNKFVHKRSVKLVMRAFGLCPGQGIERERFKQNCIENILRFQIWERRSGAS